MRTIGDIMSQPVITVQMDETLRATRMLFEKTGFHHLVVKDGPKPVGVVSVRDVLRHLSPFIGNAQMERSQDRNTLRRRVHQMLSHELVTVHMDTPLAEAADVILQRRVTCLPVIDDAGHLRGIVTWRDLLPLCFTCETDQSDAA